MSLPSQGLKTFAHLPPSLSLSHTRTHSLAPLASIIRTKATRLLEYELAGGEDLNHPS